MVGLFAPSPVFSRFLALVLAVTAVVGLLLAPMARPVMALPMTVHAATGDRMAADSHAGMAEDMPCCPKKSSLPDCDKDCPFMALCAAMALHGVSQAGLPLRLTPAAIILPGNPSALVSLAHAPPRKPPKA